MGGAIFICLYLSLPALSAHCPSQLSPVCNAQGCRRFPYPTHFIGGLIDAYSLFIPHDLRPAFQQEARRTPHSRLWCLVNTMPLPSRDLA